MMRPNLVKRLLVLCAHGLLSLGATACAFAIAFEGRII
jgi:hypothetical protein